MNDNSIAVQQLKNLKQKLESSISSRQALERDFETQSTLLLQFISKLSLACRGLDLELDNRLGQLRQLLNNKPSIEQLTTIIEKTNSVLTKQANQNEAVIAKTHLALQNAISSLQKLSGLPNQLRRDLRAILEDNSSPLDAMPAYVPLLLQLLELYNGVLAAQSQQTNKQDVTLVNRQFNAYQKAASIYNELTHDNNTTNELPAKELSATVNKNALNKFAKILTNLILSVKQTDKLKKIKASLIPDISSETFINTVIDTFELIINHLKEERETAENFLYSLNDALSNVEKAVKDTLAATFSDQDEHDAINHQLKTQLGEMSSVVENATSLVQLQSDISGKLNFIVNSLDKKSALELAQKQRLQSELTNMVKRIEGLEQQSADYEKRLHEQKLKSMQDSLTKLPNRAAFDEYFSNQLNKWHQTKFSLAVVVLDLDHFKRINDTYGHTAGDKTLQVIANTLNTFADDNYFIARFGGEEFVMVVTEQEKESLLVKLEALRDKIARLPFKFKSQKVTITISIGVTHIKLEDNMHIAFERADEALYEAKNLGRNQVIYK